MSPTKRVRRTLELEVVYVDRDGSFSPQIIGLPAIELPWPWFRAGEKVSIEITKTATNVQKRQKEKRNG